MVVIDCYYRAVWLFFKTARITKYFNCLFFCFSYCLKTTIRERKKADTVLVKSVIVKFR